MISLSPITYYAYFDEYFVSLKKYSCHVNIIFFHLERIFLFTWKKFNSCGKNILQRFFATHKNSIHCSQAHRSLMCSHSSCIGIDTSIGKGQDHNTRKSLSISRVQYSSRSDLGTPGDMVSTYTTHPCDSQELDTQLVGYTTIDVKGIVLDS